MAGEVYIIKRGGRGNMDPSASSGGVATEESRYSRVHLEVGGQRVPFYPVFVRVHFSQAIQGGSATGTAALYMDYLTSMYDTTWDIRMGTWSAVGIGTDVNWRLADGEWRGWIVPAEDDLGFTWTNPDTDDIRWGLTVGICAAQ